MAYNNVTPLRIAQAAITTSYVSIYTAPTNTRTYVKDINVCNTSGGALTVYISLVPDGGTAGTSNALFYNFSIAANTTYQWSGVQILDAGETIQVKASNTGLTITISGGEAV